MSTKELYLNREVLQESSGLGIYCNHAPLPFWNPICTLGVKIIHLHNECFGIQPFFDIFPRLDSLRAPSSTFSMGADEGYTQLKVQQYLDDVSRLNIPAEQTQWYNVDVANMLADTRIKGHEVDETSGSSLLFLERSVMLCPESGRMHHFPKHLLHCFVDDNRSKCDAADGVLMRARIILNYTQGRATGLGKMLQI